MYVCVWSCCAARRADGWLTLASQEHYENEGALTVDNTDLSQTVNLYGIKNSTIVVKGKVNAVTLCEWFCCVVCS